MKAGRIQNVHSSAFSTLFSIASAGLPNRACHTCMCGSTSGREGTISHLGAFNALSARHTISSGTFVPTRYPSVFSLDDQPCIRDRARKVAQKKTKGHLRLMLLTRFRAYCTISENRKAIADAETSENLLCVSCSTFIMT